MKDEFVAVFDSDGVITDGTFWQSEKGKELKRFGPDDFDAIDLLKEYMPVQFITGDKVGYDIMHARLVTYKGLSLELVSGKPNLRWKWIKEKFPDKKIIFIGDGIFDWLSLRESSYGITTCDALDHVQARANYVSPRTGANRFVADACLHILSSVITPALNVYSVGLEDRP